MQAIDREERERHDAAMKKMVEDAIAYGEIRDEALEEASLEAISRQKTRGDIYLADLEPRRSAGEQGGKRPFLILSDNHFSTNPRWTKSPCEIMQLKKTL